MADNDTHRKEVFRVLKRIDGVATDQITASVQKQTCDEL